MSAHAVSPNKLRGEADAYEFLERLSWGIDGPKDCPHCGSTKGAWFLRSKDPAGRKSKGGSASRSHRRVWKCRESACRRQFSVLTNTVLHGTKLPVQLWLEVVYALCTEADGLSANDVAERWGIAEKSALLVLDRIQHALETPEAAGASLTSNAPLWVRASTVETTGQRAVAARSREMDRAGSADESATSGHVEQGEQIVVDITAAEPVVELGLPAEPAVDHTSSAAVVERIDQLVDSDADSSSAQAEVESPVERVEPPVDVAPPPSRPTTPASVAEPASVREPAADDDRPRIDQQQVESDVQRVLAELVESEGLFAEGWLDASPREPVQSSLGPAWAVDEVDEAQVSTDQLDLFDDGEEE